MRFVSLGIVELVNVNFPVNRKRPMMKRSVIASIVTVLGTGFVELFGSATKVKDVERQQQRRPDRAHGDEAHPPAVMLDQQGRGEDDTTHGPNDGASGTPRQGFSASESASQ